VVVVAWWVIGCCLLVCLFGEELNWGLSFGEGYFGQVI